MKHFFERRDRWGNRSAVWVLAAMALVLPVALWALRGIDLENDVESWLPQDDPQARTFQWYKDVFPTADRVLISWDGSSLGDPRLARFQELLKGRPGPDGVRVGEVPYVTNAITPADVVARMAEGGVSRQEAVERLTGILIGPGSLKIRLTDEAARREQSVRQALAGRVKDELGLELMVIDPLPLVPPDEAAGDEADGDEAASRKPIIEPRPYHFGVRWIGMHGRPDQVAAIRKLALGLRSGGAALVAEVFELPGDPVALTAVLSPAHHGHTHEVMQAIRRTAVQAGIPAETVRLGGRPVAGSELNKKVKETAWNAAGPLWQFHERSPVFMSMLVGVVLAFVMLRSFRLTVLVLLTTNFAVMLTVALVPLTRGSMNMVLVVMPPLLSVLTLSAAIHMANYWKHAASHCPDTAVVRACRMARQPCLLASLTTAIGLLSLTTSPLAPVRDFGLYSAVGCLIGLVVVLYGLPAMLLYWPCQRQEAPEAQTRRWHRISNWLVGHWKVVTVGSVLLAVGCTIGLTHFRTETKVIRYFPDDSRVVQDYDFLEDRLSGIVPADIIIRFDRTAQDETKFYERVALVRQIEDRLRSHPDISGAMSLADFLAGPPPADSSPFQKAGFYRRMSEAEERVKAGIEGGAASFFTTAREPAALHRPGGMKVHVQPGDELWRITVQVAIMSDTNYADLIGDWSDPKKTPGDLNVLIEGAIAGAGRRAQVAHVLTGMVPLFLQTQEAVLSSLIVSFAWAFALIGIVMMILLRSVLSGLITMVPNVLPVGVVFGLISWGRVPVDIGTMITASVALGIAVDGTLHLLTWFRKGIEDNLPRREAIARALAHCGPALWQTSAAVSAGMLMLAPADLLLASRFGWLMAALIMTALAADLYLLPALLAGPLGALIERTVWRAQQAEAQQPYVVPSHQAGPQTAMVTAAEHSLADVTE